MTRLVKFTDSIYQVPRVEEAEGASRTPRPMVYQLMRGRMSRVNEARPDIPAMR